MNVYIATKISSFYVTDLREPALVHLKIGALNLNFLASNLLRPD